MFGLKTNKLINRRKFQERVWKYGESFRDYTYDKVILGNFVPVSEDEILDYVIAGIPDP